MSVNLIERSIKKPTSLDLNTNRVRNVTKTAILESPDLKRLGLTSPELENLIIQMDATSPRFQSPELQLNPLITCDAESNVPEAAKRSERAKCGISPFDIEKQEESKLERKRLRNRIAATKCRRKKLERITFLENKKEQLIREKDELQNMVDKLKSQVKDLNQELWQHINKGCIKNQTLSNFKLKKNLVTKSE